MRIDRSPGQISNGRICQAAHDGGDEDSCERDVSEVADIRVSKADQIRLARPDPGGDCGALSYRGLNDLCARASGDVGCTVRSPARGDDYLTVCVQGTERLECVTDDIADSRGLIVCRNDYRDPAAASFQGPRINQFQAESGVDRRHRRSNHAGGHHLASGVLKMSFVRSAGKTASDTSTTRS